MACCIVVLYLYAWLRRAVTSGWSALRGGPPSPATPGFAPPAHRPVRFPRVDEVVR